MHPFSRIQCANVAVEFGLRCHHCLLPACFRGNFLRPTARLTTNCQCCHHDRRCAPTAHEVPPIGFATSHLQMLKVEADFKSSGSRERIWGGYEDWRTRPTGGPEPVGHSLLRERGSARASTPRVRAAPLLMWCVRSQSR